VAVEVFVKADLIPDFDAITIDPGFLHVRLYFSAEIAVDVVFQRHRLGIAQITAAGIG
jgi:hypothetical protein